jgi:ParB family chromosome partitioning protein
LGDVTAEKNVRLGRGLGALLGTRTAPPTRDAQPVAEALTESVDGAGVLRSVPIAQIRPNPYQPRKEFRAEELADLENSLRTSGLLQPVSVRAVRGAPGYELIAGERRLRAAQRLGWTEIPAVVKEIDDRDLLALALVENLQRADLNPIEEAEGYQRLIDEFALTQQEVADVVGKDRSTVANILRLRQLPAAVRRMVSEGALTLGHARALLALGDEHAIREMAREIVTHGLSVRDVERRARESQTKRLAGGGSRARTEDARTAEARRIEDRLRKRLQTDVTLVVGAKQRGEIRIPFYSADDLERVLELVLGRAPDIL